MGGLKAWKFGFLLIITFILLSEASIAFNEYLYGRLGLSRNLILTLLWLLPALASFISALDSADRTYIKALSYIATLSLLGPAAHFLLGQSGVPIDFGGLAGLRVTFKIYLILSVTAVGIGLAAGVLFRKTIH